MSDTSFNEFNDLVYKCINSISKKFESFKIDENLIVESNFNSDNIVDNFRNLLFPLVNEIKIITNECYNKAKEICDEADIIDRHSYNKLELLNSVETDSVYVKLKNGLDIDLQKFKGILSNNILRYLIMIRLKDTVLNLEYKYIDSVKEAIYPMLHKLKEQERKK